MRRKGTWRNIDTKNWHARVDNVADDCRKLATWRTLETESKQCIHNRIIVSQNLIRRWHRFKEGQTHLDALCRQRMVQWLVCSLRIQNTRTVSLCTANGFQHYSSKTTTTRVWTTATLRMLHYSWSSLVKCTKAKENIAGLIKANKQKSYHKRQKRHILRNDLIFLYKILQMYCGCLCAQNLQFLNRKF